MKINIIEISKGVEWLLKILFVEEGVWIIPGTKQCKCKNKQGILP